MIEGAPPLAKGDFGISWYVLRNKARRQAVLLQWRANEPFTASVGITATWVHATRGLLEVDSAETGRLFKVDAAWLDGAELLLVEPRPLGVLTRPLIIDNLMLFGPPAGSALSQPAAGSLASPLTLAGKTRLPGSVAERAWGRLRFALSPLSAHGNATRVALPAEKAPRLSRPVRHVLRTDAVGSVRGASSEAAVPRAQALPMTLPDPRIPNPESRAGTVR